MDEGFYKLIPFLVLLFVWLMAFIGMRHRRMRSEARRDVQLALLSKFQNGDEITRFLATDEGRRLLDQLAGPSRDPRQDFVGLLIPACILGSMAAGFGALATFAGEPDLWVPATIMASVCLGLLLAAAVTRRLSTKNRNRDD